MKTVYTDRYAIRIWIWLFLALSMGYNGLARDQGWLKILSLVAAAYWAFLLLKEIKRRRTARIEGKDPSIYKVVEDAPNP